MKKTEPTIPPLPQEEESFETDEEVEPEVLMETAPEPQARAPKQKIIAQPQAPIQISEEDIEKLNKEVARLQNNGVFRMELLFLLEDIAKSLKKLTGGQ